MGKMFYALILGLKLMQLYAVDAKAVEAPVCGYTRDIHRLSGHSLR